MKRLKVDVTTAADGTATVLSAKSTGKIHSVHYVKDGTTAFTDGVDFIITANDTGENIWTQSNVNASAVVYPRAATHSQAGVAALFAAAGEAVRDKVGLGNDQVKIVIAQGGNAKKGRFFILVD
jgi:hypothetical protein